MEPEAVAAAAKHVPFTERQPAVKFIPFEKVEVAVAEVALKRFIESPPAKLLVAVLEVALNVLAATKFPTTKFLEMSTSPEMVEVAEVEVAEKEERARVE